LISEVDIKDWERSPVSGKLYNVTCDSVVSLVEEPEVAFNFLHVDGMYSLCLLLDGTPWHPVAWSDVFVWSKK
jgi:hypothetical protein